MNTTAITAAIRSRSSIVSLAKVRDFFELTKPRLSAMVLVTVAVTMVVSETGTVSAWLVAWTVASTGLVAASACAWNQVVEREIDRRMQRTALRPLPDGRLGEREATCFATAMLVAGCLGLACSGGVWTALLGLLTWLTYVAVYTPMKRYSVWNTFYGAIAGALPVLIGWSATATPLDPHSLLKALIIFGIVFVWQFPHFMAIAWKYRTDYAAASLRMASVTDPTGRLASIIAVVGALLLIPIAAALAFVGGFAPTYLVLTILLGLWQFRVACDFARHRNAQAATRLLRTSLVYLPLLLLCITCLPILHLV